MLTMPQTPNYLPQTTNVFPAPLQPTKAILPFTIDPLAYISDVYDSLFATQVAGSTPLLKNIRNILIKKLLLEHAAQELPFHPILTFDDHAMFNLYIMRQTVLLS